MPTPSPEEVRADEVTLPITYAPEERGADEVTCPIMYAPGSIDGIRKRPGMYVGDTTDGSALHHLIWELIGNSVDHHLAGQVTRIDLTLQADGGACIEDDGPGIPVTPWADSGLSFLEVAVTALHFGATLDDHYPHAHVGLSGVGMVAVTALSERFLVETAWEGRLFRLESHRGQLARPIEDLGPTDRRGTRVSFWPDPAIFPAVRFDALALMDRLRELSCLVPSLTLNFQDERGCEIRSPGGLVGLLDQMRAGRHSRTAPLSVTETEGIVEVAVALQWAEGAREQIQSFANLQRTPGDGSHVDGLLDAVTHHLPPAPATAPASRRYLAPHGLLAAVSVVLRDARYAGPTRERLEVPEAREAVRAVTSRLLARALQETPGLRERIAGG